MKRSTVLRWLIPAAVIVAIIAVAQIAGVTGDLATQDATTNTEEQRLSGGTAPSGIDGAGFINTIAVAPDGSGRVVAGGDVSGFHYNSDFGAAQWDVRNAGRLTDEELHIAGMTWGNRPNIVYAGSGWNGAAGGFYRSDDGGKSWTRRSKVPQFMGGNTNNPLLPDPHPRSTGNLIAVHPTSGAVYAATFNDGIMRSTDGGDTWTPIGLAGSFARAIVLDPAGSTTLYVAAYQATGGSIWRIDSAATTPRPIRLTSSPNKVEDLLLLGNRLYSAGADGVARATTPVQPAAAWTKFPAAGRNVYSLAGFATSGKDTVYAGCFDAPDSDGNQLFECMKKTTDGGTTWKNLSNDAAGINTTVAGTSHPWWFSQNPRGQSNLFGKNGYVASHIVVDPANHDRVIIAGRSGVWRSTDAGAHWQPAVNGMGGTMNRSIAIDPNMQRHVQVANTDWINFDSDDRLENVTAEKVGGRAMGISVTFDAGTNPSTAYLAVGDRDVNTDGEVFANDSSGWKPLGLGALVGGKRPIGIAVGRDANDAPYVLAVVQGNGLWRRSGGSWTRVSDVIGADSPDINNKSEIPVRIVPSTKLVYVFDRASGVWRSSDYGRTWNRIWNVDSRKDYTGDLAADPTRPGLVYVQAGTSVFQLRGADSGNVESGGITKVDITNRVGGSGPLTVASNGNAWVSTRPTESQDTKLMVSFDGGLTWADKADDRWRGAAGFAYDIVASSGNVVYAGCTTGVQRFKLW